MGKLLEAAQESRDAVSVHLAEVMKAPTKEEEIGKHRLDEEAGAAGEGGAVAAPAPATAAATAAEPEPEPEPESAP